MALCEEPRAGTDLGRYTLGMRLESGSFGVVFRARASGRHTTNSVVVKVYFNRNTRENFRRQIDLWGTFHHRNVLALLDHSDSQMYAVCAYMDRGDLFGARLGSAGIRRCVFGILRGVRYLHQNGVLHGDLKLENVLRDSNGNVKIADFDFARRMPTPLDVDGTLGSLAPECFEQEVEVSGASDLWSVGVICCELHGSVAPFEGRTNEETAANIVAVRYEMPTNVSADAARFIRSALCLRDHRANINALLASEYLAAHRSY